MQIKLPVPEKRSQLSTLPSNPIYQSQTTQPCVPIQSSLPLIKHSHIMHTLHHKNPIFPLQPYNNLALMFLGQLQDMKHQMSPMQQAQNLMLQNLMNNMWPTAAWSEDLPSNTMHAKLSCPNCPNRMYSFLFMNIAHLC